MDINPCADSGLPYGLAENGKLARVADVPRGLACGCRCPSCGGPLVARKGEVKAAHFAHHAVRECTGAWETTLHLLAKEVLLNARRVLLPEAIATFEGASEAIPGAVSFPYEEVVEEVDLGSIRPDIILTGGARKLLVEVAVTHFCDAEKIAKLRDRDLTAIEIDLSSVPRLASREEHAAAILEGAPRTWLHNAKILAAEVRLREEAERRKAERLERQKVAWRLEADRLAEALSGELEPLGGPWESEARDAGVGGLLGREVEGDFCFCVPRALWQARFVAHALEDFRGEPFGMEDVHARMLSQGFYRPGFDKRHWSEAEVEFLRGRLPGFRPPRAVLTTYAGHLAAEGFLWSFGDGHWFVPPVPLAAARDATRHTSEVRSRQADLARLLRPIREALGADGGAVLSGWVERPLPGTTHSPAQLTEAGGDAWRDLGIALLQLSAMSKPGGAPLPPGRLLDLPLSDVRRKRVAETEAREAADEERRRKAAANFISRIAREARIGLGEDAGKAWLAARLG